jgi:hypothetical protein
LAGKGHDQLDRAIGDLLGGQALSRTLDRERRAGFGDLLRLGVAYAQGATASS